MNGEEIRKESDENGIEPLTWLQMRFLAERLQCRTDTEAAEIIGVRTQTPSEWKANCPAFKAKYDELGRDGLELAKTMIRATMGKAAAALAGNLVGKPSDVNEAAKTILTLGGMATSQNLNVNVDPAQVAGSLGWKPKGDE
jgi:hypothetical protein